MSATAQRDVENSTSGSQPAGFATPAQPGGKPGLGPGLSWDWVWFSVVSVRFHASPVFFSNLKHVGNGRVRAAIEFSTNVCFLRGLGKKGSMKKLGS